MTWPDVCGTQEGYVASEVVPLHDAVISNLMEKTSQQCEARAIDEERLFVKRVRKIVIVLLFSVASFS